MTYLTINYLTVNFICVVAMAALGYIIKNNTIFGCKMKKYFLLTTAGIIVGLVAEMGTIICVDQSMRIANSIFNQAGFAITPFIPIAATVALSNEKLHYEKLLIVPAIFDFVLSVSSPWFGWVFWISEKNQYFRGTYFPIYVIACFSGVILLLIQTVKLVKHYQSKRKNILLLIFFFIVIGTLIQVVFPHIHASWVCVTIGFNLFYTYFCELSELHDGLTGMLNRRSYEKDLKRIENNGYGTFIIADIDDFKSVNDNYGHHQGDLCLIAIGHAIRDAINNKGLCYRIGGDEFCIICCSTDMTEAENLIKKIKEKIQRDREKGIIIPEVSFGFSIYKKSEGDIISAINLADSNMYNEKELKKNKTI